MYGARPMTRLFDDIVESVRADNEFMVAGALFGWLAEEDDEEAEIRFLVVEDLWHSLDHDQRLTLTCEALAGLWATVPDTHEKYERLGRLPE
jgi:hypothetical protein